MAVIIPCDREPYEFNGSYGERLLYEQFANLPDDYYIFHSVRWINREKNKNSVRFGEADFTIFNPRYGILCIEVKHGGIKCENGRIYQINNTTHEEIEIDPMFQANRSKYYFKGKILGLLKNDVENYYVQSVVWFTNITKKDIRGDFPLDYDLNGNVLLKEDILTLEKSLEAIFSFYKMNRRGYSNQIKNKIINLLSPEFSAFPSMSSLFDEEEFFFNRMTNEQAYLIDYLEDQKVAAIQGGAGTGKTMLAIEKARRLSQNERVIFLCYNKLLVDHLTRTFSQELPNVSFTNLNSIASRALNLSADRKEISNFLENINKYPEIWDFTSIIIDEGQDFDEYHLSLLRVIAEYSDGSYYVFYDKNQLIQQRNSLTWVQDIECRLVLTLNCRNTFSIAETSSKAVGVDKVKMRQIVAGEKPLLKNVSTKEELIMAMNESIRDLTDSGVTKDRIVILTTKTMERSVLNGTDKIGNYSLSKEIVKGRILFTTVRKFKGLEADVVILIDVDGSTFNSDENRRVFYVGASRAKHLLKIFTMLDVEGQKELYRSISGGTLSNKISLVKHLSIREI